MVEAIREGYSPDEEGPQPGDVEEEVGSESSSAGLANAGQDGQAENCVLELAQDHRVQAEARLDQDHRQRQVPGAEAQLQGLP